MIVRSMFIGIVIALTMLISFCVAFADEGEGESGKLEFSGILEEELGYIIAEGDALDNLKNPTAIGKHPRSKPATVSSISPNQAQVLAYAGTIALLSFGQKQFGTVSVLEEWGKSPIPLKKSNHPYAKLHRSDMSKTSADGFLRLRYGLRCTHAAPDGACWLVVSLAMLNSV